tara:strand:+ start:62 stop:340 length:279 start_codon:yes stop_codon:yes gene_type:complete
MKNKKKKTSKKVAGSHRDESYLTATVKNLHLDKEIKALPSTHKRVNGKDVPVNVQIVDYLKSMGLLESSSCITLSEQNLREMIRKILIKTNT